jgi:hypothetical protein
MLAFPVFDDKRQVVVIRVYRELDAYAFLAGIAPQKLESVLASRRPIQNRIAEVDHIGFVKLRFHLSSRYAPSDDLDQGWVPTRMHSSILDGTIAR